MDASMKNAVEEVGPIELPVKIEGDAWMAYLDYEYLHKQALRHAEELDAARAEIAKLRAEREGKVLVPREPSERIIASVGTILQPGTAKLTWQRMLAAAEEESRRA